MRPDLVNLLSDLKKPEAIQENTAPAGPSEPTPSVPDEAPKTATQSPVFGSRRRAMPPASPPEIKPPAPEVEQTTKRAMRILAAEDNKTNRLVFSKLVKDLDIDLKFATDGFEAVQAFHDFKPDLVFMDISMPGMDGKEATRTIRAHEAKNNLLHTRIVALTAHVLADVVEECTKVGMDDYLSKPLKSIALLQKIWQLTQSQA